MLLNARTPRTGARRAYPIRLTLIVTCLMIGLPLTAAAESMSIHPVRLVLEDGDRYGQVELVNNGNATTTYRITFVNRRMNEDGSFEDITGREPSGLYSANYLQFSPRQVTLEAGASQVVRLRVTRPPQQDGEYRSHLMFRVVPTQQAANDGEQGDSGMSLQLIPVYGITIPVILRQGEQQAGLDFANPVRMTGDDGQAHLELALHRSGERSVYGDLMVFGRTERGKERQLGARLGIAVYSPNRVRRIRVPLDQALAQGSTVRVLFRERDDAARVPLEASEELTLQ